MRAFEFDERGAAAVVVVKRVEKVFRRESAA